MIDAQEVFLPFEASPRFREAPAGKILHVELPTERHLYWPDLDINLEIESVFNSERFPLISRVHEEKEQYAGTNHGENVDLDKIDDCALALLHLTLHDGVRAWIGFDFEVMDRLFRKGYILNPSGKAKSVVLTEEGLARSGRLFDELFGMRTGGKRRGD